MGNTKEEIEMWAISDIIKYAFQRYDVVRDCFDNKFSSSHYVYPSYRMAVVRALEKHGIIARKKKGDNSKYEVSDKIGKYFVDDVLKDYFINADKKTLNEEYEKIREEYEEMDSKLSDLEEEILSCTTTSPNEPNTSDNHKESIRELRKENPVIQEYFDENGVYKGRYRYQIPSIPEEDIYFGFADEVIDRIMLRAIFDKFYTFDEEAFRRDLEERSRCIDSTLPATFLSGYSELTSKLENPLGNYIFPKEAKQKNQGKKR